MSRADLFTVLAERHGLPEQAWRTLLSEESRQEWLGIKVQSERAAFIERLQKPAEVQTSAPADDTPKFPELERIIDQAFAGFGEDLKAVLDAARPEPMETGIEESVMPKMDLTAAEVELIEKRRKGRQMEISDEEAALITGQRAPRRYTIEDLDHERWIKLSPAEQDECKRQIAEATAAAQRGE